MDEAELSCAMDIDRGALQDELQGAGGADDARQSLSATPAGDHACQDLDLPKHDRRVVRRVPQVACERELMPTGSLCKDTTA